MIEAHKKQLEWWKSKLGISDYGVAWIAFVKGIFFGLLFYHFLINSWDFKVLKKPKVRRAITNTFKNA